MKKILTILFFLISISVYSIETPNEVKIEVPANIHITENKNNTFNIIIKSDDYIITKLTKIVNGNNSYIIKLDRPIEPNEVKSFTEAGIKIIITTPKPVKLIPGKNIEIRNTK